ncbi:phosphatase PAP2 family protein [Aestuariimicrobium soli]|uniref:phosphatase PAP2 family protein n=1 Tax=Aestuariimicrobium soli TaxID=2035834 RepID=UPI003EBEB71C
MRRVRSWQVGLPLLLVSFLLGVVAARWNPRRTGEWQTLDAIRGLRTAWLDPIAHGVEIFGGPAWTPWIILAVAVVLFLLRRRFAAVTFALASGLAWLPGHVLKKVVHRQRPEQLDAMTSYSDGMSMPSGHTAIVAAVTIAGCLVLANERRRLRWVVVAGVALTAFVGFFRMYAAAHYPLDLLVGAGLATGAGLSLWRPSLALNRRINRGGGFWALPPAVNPERPAVTASRAEQGQ